MTHLLGFMGSALIILQLAALSHGFTSQQVLVVAMVAATVWIGYAMLRRDIYLLATNAIAFMAGISGIIFV